MGKDRCKEEQKEFQCNWNTCCREEGGVRSRWKHALGQVVKSLRR